MQAYFHLTLIDSSSRWANFSLLKAIYCYKDVFFWGGGAQKCYLSCFFPSIKFNKIILIQVLFCKLLTKNKIFIFHSSYSKS